MQAVPVHRKGATHLSRARNVSVRKTQILVVRADAKRNNGSPQAAVGDAFTSFDMSTTADFTALQNAVREMASKVTKEVLVEGIHNEGLKKVLLDIEKRDPNQGEFLQAVKEVAVSLQPALDKHPDLLPIFKQIAEPERVITFRVTWMDDNHNLRVNRGFRVQFNSAIGPYKGGIRFHPSVNLSIMKFLAFEQIFKNALTTLPMGGAKGGSDFNPKGKSDAEIMRFCQSYMTELYRHISYVQDVPAGDIGVGAREIGYMFGQYKRITKDFTGVLTGKGPEWGGSHIRPEATGYGAVFFAENILKDIGEDLQGKRCLISGAGNVAQYCAQLLLEKGAVVLSLSDSKGYVYEPNGFSKNQLEQVMLLKKQHGGSLSAYVSETGKYVSDARPWGIDAPIDMAFPCATQNEIDEKDARELISHGCKYVVEGANMPSTPDAIDCYTEAGIVYAPGKAANAGGVAVSGLEMSQNRLGLSWSREEVTERLQVIMNSIYNSAKAASVEYGTDLAGGANIAGFMKVAMAVKAQGAV